jgi:hypothetical protein
LTRVYGYPSFALELVNETVKDGTVPPATQTTTIIMKPAQLETKDGFTVGQRVKTKYGDVGTVTGFRDRFVDVKVDGSFHSTGWFLTSLIPLSSNPTPTPVVAPVAGVSRQSQAFGIARAAAVQLAKVNPERRITIDTVQSELEDFGYKSTDLGNSAGVIFKGGLFRDTGVTVKSNRPGNRGRRVIVWEYIGPNVTPAPRAPRGWKVEKSVDGGKTWEPSSNTTEDGQTLRTHVFPTLEKANKEVQRQLGMSASPTRLYQAAPVS